MGFRNFTRLTSTDFEDLLLMIGELIMKKDTKFREAITVSLRLAVTLCFQCVSSIVADVVHTSKMWCNMSTVACCLPFRSGDHRSATFWSRNRLVDGDWSIDVST